MPKTAPAAQLKKPLTHLLAALTATCAAVGAAGVGAAATADATGYGPVNPTLPLTAGPAMAQAALIVGGTTFPTLDSATMAAYTNTFAPNHVNVPYPAQLRPFTDGDSLGQSVAAGVNSLLDLLASTYSVGQQLVVWGISQGALVLGAAQRALAQDPGAPPPDALTFVRVADPAAASNGMLRFLPELVLSELLNIESTLRTAPGDSQYNSIVITNEYDAFADWPDRPNLLAVTNALMGLFYRHGQTAIADLSDVPSDNVSTSVNAAGASTITYLVPAPFLPLTQPLRDLGVADHIVDRIDANLKPVIDSGYSRNTAKSGESAAAATADTTATADLGLSQVARKRTAGLHPARSASPPRTGAAHPRPSSTSADRGAARAISVRGN